MLQSSIGEQSCHMVLSKNLDEASSGSIFELEL